MKQLADVLGPRARGEQARGAGGVRGKGRPRRQLDKSEAGNGRRRHPSSSTMRRRRATGGALAIDMASLRSVGRCERFGALQRRMALPAHRSPPRLPHLLCIYRAARAKRPGMQRCRLHHRFVLKLCYLILYVLNVHTLSSDGCQLFAPFDSLRFMQRYI